MISLDEDEQVPLVIEADAEDLYAMGLQVSMKAREARHNLQKINKLIQQKDNQLLQEQEEPDDAADAEIFSFR